MTSDFEETTDNHGPAFAAFAYNLLEDILAQADNPAQMNRELVEQLRELTGARLVVLARRPAWEKGHELAAVEPERRRPLAESPIMMALANRTRHLAGPTLWEKENAPPEAKTLLAENLPGPAVAAPLRVGGKRVGALLLFGLPHEHSLDQVVDALDMLARVVALVLRNAALYEDQEAAIAARTRQLAEAHERLDVTLRSIGDAVIATDIQGNVTLINLVAEHLTGWKEAEAQGRPLAEIFPIINEQTRREVENPVTQVLNKGVVVGLANHTLLIARDGAERPIADSGAPIRDAQGDISGVVLVFRDQTKERAAQKALQESEEKFRRAVLNAPFPIMLHAENGEVLQINAEWESLTGYAIDEISTIGDWTEKAYGERKRSVQADIDRLYDLDTKVDAGRYEIITRSGQKRTWEFSSAPLGRLPDERRLVISMAVDITKRVQAEDQLSHTMEKLAASEKRLKTIIETEPECVKILAANGSLVDMNRTGLDMIEADSLEQVRGQPILPIIAPEHRRPFRAMLDNVMRGHTETLVFEIIGLKGTHRWLEAHSAPLFDAGNKITGLLGVTRDITERVQAEESLRQLNQAMEQSPVSVMITDTEGTIQYVNPKFSQVTGYSAAETMGQNARLLQSGEHPPQFYRDLWNTITAGQEWQGVFHNRKQNGQLFWSQASIAGVKDQSGEITHYVTVSEDITQRKQREEEHVRQERLAAVGQLAAGIAHDFNNVMAVITLYSDLLERSANLSKKDLEKVQTIHQQARRAADLTRQILDFSRRSVREPRPLDLKLLLNEMLKFIERTIPERVQMQFAFSKGDYMVNADPTQLQQVVTNLTVNARDAMPQGGSLHINLSRLTLGAGETPPDPDMEPGEWLRLAVADTGDGITPEVLPHIFEPFFTTKEVGKGTGLGLAQVYGIVRQHEGYITVDSRLGEGATFAIYLPALAGEDNVETAEPLTVLSQGQGETVLLVEDSQILLDAVRSVLASLNYQVIAAINGAEALNIYRTQSKQISLVLTDVVMPQMDGFELVKALQQYSPPPKVLMMSGFPRDTDMPPEMQQLISGWLRKPLNIDQLARMLREVLP